MGKNEPAGAHRPSHRRPNSAPAFKAAATRKKPMMMANTAHGVFAASYVVLIIDGRESTRLSQNGNKGSSLDG